MMLRDKLVCSFRLPAWWRKKKQDAILGRKKIWLCFFSSYQICSFSLSTACLFGETSFLIPPVNMPLFYFEGGGVGLDLKAEKDSLPSWGLLYHFFSLVSCRHLPYDPWQLYKHWLYKTGCTASQKMVCTQRSRDRYVQLKSPVMCKRQLS